MNETVETLKDIIQNNVDDLPLNESVVNDKIVLDRKNRIYKKVSSINIPKHDIIISRVTKHYFKGWFIFEKKNGFDQTYFLKYKKDIIPITTKEWNMLTNLWYDVTENARKEKWDKDTFKIIMNTMAG